MKWDEVLGLAQRPGTVTLHRPGSDAWDLPCEGTGPNPKTSEACLLSSYLLTRESAWLDCAFLTAAGVSSCCPLMWVPASPEDYLMEQGVKDLSTPTAWTYFLTLSSPWWDWVSWVQEKDPLSLNHSSPVRTQCVVLAVCVTAYYQTNRDINLYFKLI